MQNIWICAIIKYRLSSKRNAPRNKNNSYFGGREPRTLKNQSSLWTVSSSHCFNDRKGRGLCIPGVQGRALRVGAQQALHGYGADETAQKKRTKHHNAWAISMDSRLHRNYLPNGEGEAIWIYPHTGRSGAEPRRVMCPAEREGRTVLAPDLIIKW